MNSIMKRTPSTNEYDLTNKDSLTKGRLPQSKDDFKNKDNLKNKDDLANENHLKNV